MVQLRFAVVVWTATEIIASVATFVCVASWLFFGASLGTTGRVWFHEVAPFCVVSILLRHVVLPRLARAIPPEVDARGLLDVSGLNLGGGSLGLGTQTSAARASTRGEAGTAGTMDAHPAALYLLKNHSPEDAQARTPSERSERVSRLPRGRRP